MSHLLFRRSLSHVVLRAFFIFPAPIFVCNIVLAQSSKGEAVNCYKDVIKEPLTFYGNPGDSFTLYDNSTWKVASGGQYEYVPARYKDVMICPAVGKLMIGNRVLSITKS
jgi:hypothetical protein